MRRLAIIDLVTGEQPAFNEDKSVSVVLNGEIYNYRELRRCSRSAAIRFAVLRTRRCYRISTKSTAMRWSTSSTACLRLLLWDGRRRRLLIARDRFGEKPLYWGVFDNTLLFASEPKVLLAHPAVKPSLNLQALRQYLSFDYVPAPLSIYEGINKLPAAHKLTLENGERRASSVIGS